MPPEDCSRCGKPAQHGYHRGNGPVVCCACKIETLENLDDIAARKLRQAVLTGDRVGAIRAMVKQAVEAEQLPVFEWIEAMGQLLDERELMVDELLAIARIVCFEKGESIVEQVHHQRNAVIRQTGRALDLEAALRRALAALVDIDQLHGEGLEVANWHRNGDLEPLDGILGELDLAGAITDVRAMLAGKEAPDAAPQ